LAAAGERVTQSLASGWLNFNYFLSCRASLSSRPEGDKGASPDLQGSRTKPLEPPLNFGTRLKVENLARLSGGRARPYSGTHQKILAFRVRRTLKQESLPPGLGAAHVKRQTNGAGFFRNSVQDQKLRSQNGARSLKIAWDKQSCKCASEGIKLGPQREETLRVPPQPENYEGIPRARCNDGKGPGSQKPAAPHMRKNY